MIHFVSKDAMDIKHFGEANVEKFNKLQLLPDVPGIYKLDFDKISELGGFGKNQSTILNSRLKPRNSNLYIVSSMRLASATLAKPQPKR